MQTDVPGCSGLPVRQFLSRGIELIDSRRDLEPEEMERLPTYDLWWQHSERLASLDPAIRDLSPSGIFSKHPLRRLSPALSKIDRPIDRVATASHQAIAALDQLANAIRQSGIPDDQWNTIRGARQLLDYAHRALPIAKNGNLSIVESTSDRAKQFFTAIQRIAEADRDFELVCNETTAWQQKLSQTDLQTALTQAQAWNGKLLAWLSPEWWRLRGVLRRSYDFSRHAVRPTWLQILGVLQAEYDAQRARDKLLQKTQAEFAIEVDPRAFQQGVEAFRRELQQLPPWLRRIHFALAKSSKAAEIVERTLAAEPPIAILTEALDSIVVDFEDLSLIELRQEMLAIKEAARQVPNVLGVLAELEQLPPAIAATLRQSAYTIAEAEAAIAYRTWDQLLRTHRDLDQFDHRVRERTVARLESRDDRWQTANAAEILHRVREEFVEHVRIANLSVTQLNSEQREFKKRDSQGRRTLEHEFGKSMRYKAIRELVESDAAFVIQDLKPVWLMSPLSVSDTLPLNTALFDVVIFDEASQVPLEESVPTLFRGPQVIVVGDEMQLPPTDFFSAKQIEDDSDTVLEENGQSLKYDLDSDSLLNHAARNLPSTMLGWHYRSRSESLISFSNWAFYDGRLLTVPDCQLLHADHADHKISTPEIDFPAGVEKLLSQPVSFHQIADGVYDQRQNRREAEYIAQLVCGVLKLGEGLSIGVIAFSECSRRKSRRTEPPGSGR